MSSEASREDFPGAVDASPESDPGSQPGPTESDRSNHAAFPFVTSELEAPFPRFRDYKVLRELGRGGMGVVYKALHARLDRLVALKAFLVDAAPGEHREEFFARFLHEAELLARFSGSGNIVQVYDIVQDEEGLDYIAMEYVEGVTLERLLKEGVRPSLGESVEIVRQTARALHLAHERDVVHRDVKPGNIMIAKDGSVKVMDFGIARSSASPIETKEGHVFGTTHFMAPEQLQRKSKSDGRSDIYALGIVLYALVCRRLPFDDPNPMALLRKQREEAPIPPREIRPAVPAALEQAILKSLAKKPEERCQTAAAFDRELAGVAAAHPELADPRKRRVGKFLRKVFGSGGGETQPDVPVENLDHTSLMGVGDAPEPDDDNYATGPTDPTTGGAVALETDGLAGRSWLASAPSAVSAFAEEADNEEDHDSDAKYFRLASDSRTFSSPDLLASAFSGDVGSGEVALAELPAAADPSPFDTDFAPPGSDRLSRRGSGSNPVVYNADPALVELAKTLTDGFEQEEEVDQAEVGLIDPSAPDFFDRVAPDAPGTFFAEPLNSRLEREAKSAADAAREAAEAATAALWAGLALATAIASAIVVAL
jgi:serine/threonine protein kinase